MNAFLSPAALAAVVASVALTPTVMGCSSSSPTPPRPVAPDVSGGETDGDGRGGKNNDRLGSGSTPEPSDDGTVGVVAIDVQKVFFTTATAENPAANVGERMQRAERIFKLAGQHNVPLFVTYEASNTGDHSLPPSLAAALPPHAKEFIKTTFGAMGQPQFAAALQSSGIKRFMVIGAETDVCVMQTILGMRRAGFEVLAIPEAIFTEELNSGPALRRYRQAGVVELSMAEAERLLTLGGSTPEPPEVPQPASVRPLETGIVLHNLKGMTATDPNSTQKKARLKELLLISEWFKIPLLAADPPGTKVALPADLRSILTRPIVPLSSRPSNVKQIVLAGGHEGIAEAASNLRQSGEVFIVEDAVFGVGGAELEPLYASGIIPTTYKSFYYEMTVSVNDAEWPSQNWVTAADPYFNLTTAPEELPPLRF